MSEKSKSQLGFYIIGYMILSASVVGFFVGLQSPMRNVVAESDTPAIRVASEENGVMLATSYSEMGAALRSHRPVSTPVSFAPAKYKPKQGTQPGSTGEKLAALAGRARNRAFNGAPPSVPHPVEQMTAQSCMACHGEGMETKTLRAPKMSHQYYANCTQCHVEGHSVEFLASASVGNAFEGLAAPLAGPRAYAGAPPQVPHSTWMRENCLSCHGFASRKGIQTTHPWRTNCTQCHAPSAELDQVLLPKQSAFLSPPSIRQ